jgi:hypothetical protein
MGTDQQNRSFEGKCGEEHRIKTAPTLDTKFGSERDRTLLLGPTRSTSRRTIGFLETRALSPVYRW